MELNIITVLADLISEVCTIKNKLDEDSYDIESLWCLYGKLNGYKRLLSCIVNACEDETDAAMLRKISSELCDRLVCGIEEELDCKEKASGGTRKNRRVDTQGVLQWHHAEKYRKPEIGEYVLIWRKHPIGPQYDAQVAYWNGDLWVTDRYGRVDVVKGVIYWAPLNMPEGES